MTATLTAEARAKTLGLRTYRLASRTFKVECVSKDCEHLINDRWHVVMVGEAGLLDRCDCIHGSHLYRGTCHHIGAVRRRRDFTRPASTRLPGPLEGWS